MVGRYKNQNNNNSPSPPLPPLAATATTASADPLAAPPTLPTAAAAEEYGSLIQGTTEGNGVVDSSANNAETAAPAPGVSTVTAMSYCRNNQNFPAKLHYMLSETERNAELATIIHWLAHGRAFKCFDQKRFVQEILPIYFRQTKWESFQRQLNLYGFKRICKGVDKGAYYHTMFIKNLPSMSFQIPRIKLKHNGPRKPDPDDEPNFYAMPQVQLVNKTAVVAPSPSTTSNDDNNGVQGLVSNMPMSVHPIQYQQMQHRQHIASLVQVPLPALSTTDSNSTSTATSNGNNGSPRMPPAPPRLKQPVSASPQPLPFRHASSQHLLQHPHPNANTTEAFADDPAGTMMMNNDSAQHQHEQQMSLAMMPLFFSSFGSSSSSGGQGGGGTLASHHQEQLLAHQLQQQQQQLVYPHHSPSSSQFSHPYQQLQQMQDRQVISNSNSSIDTNSQRRTSIQDDCDINDVYNDDDGFVRAIWDAL